MARTASNAQILLARIAITLILIFAVFGLLRHGLSADVRERLLNSLIERPAGPMSFRIFLQPVMAMSLAAVDGYRDAKSGERPYTWSLLTRPGESGGRLYDGVIATARVLILGLVMDVAYQLIVFSEFFPGEAALVAVLLAFLPYLLLRGPFGRLARWWLGPAKGSER